MHPSSTPIIPEAWSLQKVAQTLGVCETTVRRLLATGAFPGAYRVGAKLIRIPITDVDAYQHRKRLRLEPPRATPPPTRRLDDPPRRSRLDGFGDSRILPADDGAEA